MFDWQWPWIALLLPAPWIARLVLGSVRQHPAVIRVPFFASLTAGRETVNAIPNPYLHHLLFALMWVCLILSAARPVYYGEAENIAVSGRDLLLVIDISDSMRVDDMYIDNTQTSRINVVKSVASHFVERRLSDRIGLILFGRQSYLQTPLTFDRASVTRQLNDALPGFAGSSTAIGDAIGMAIKLLRNRPAKSRVLILLSDGSNTYGSDPLEAMQVAVEAEIKIHTIGFGAETQRVTNAQGQTQDIDPSRDLDEDTLTQLAASTGGRYFRARNAAELAEIYATIDQLEPAPAEEFVRPQRSLYHWPLVAALFCFAVSLLRREDIFP